jgi:5'/3'-nucleotidase SurE
MVDKKPDLIISGVNAGLNIGGDCGFSGTVGAAMTADVLGIPGVALSQAWRERNNIPWQTSKEWLPSVVKKLIELPSWPWNFVPKYKCTCGSSCRRQRDFYGEARHDDKGFPGNRTSS